MGAASSIAAAAAVASAGAGIYSATQKSKAPSVSGNAAGSGVPEFLFTPSYGFSHNAEAADFNRRGGLALSGPARLTGLADQMGTSAGEIAGLRPGIAELRTGLRGLNFDLGTLRSQVQPGFGRLTEARVTAIRDAAAESIGNLRDSLARRNVLGSSFANDAFSRTRLAFAQEEEKARAESALQEIQLSTQLLQEQAANYGQQLGLLQEDRINIAQQATIYQSQAQILANQMDRELQEFAIASNALNGVQSAVNQQAVAQSQLDALASAQTSFNRGFALQQLPGLAGGLSTLFGAFGGATPTPGDPTFGAGPAGLGA